MITISPVISLYSTHLLIYTVLFLSLTTEESQKWKFLAHIPSGKVANGTFPFSAILCLCIHSTCRHFNPDGLPFYKRLDTILVGLFSIQVESLIFQITWHDLQTSLEHLISMLNYSVNSLIHIKCVPSSCLSICHRLHWQLEKTPLENIPSNTYFNAVFSLQFYNVIDNVNMNVSSLLAELQWFPFSMWPPVTMCHKLFPDGAESQLQNIVNFLHHLFGSF